ncbi:hypothetical protein BEE62_16990 [Marinobacter nauticus]|uniref:Efflux transporter outer membrane subunit n=2 Tax=Marinobacter nauticus TaxID=2743 RepID=A0A1M2USW1_MARNT|nr:hypothetical protein BEE62_16990 [Marinobacter nauticus]
MIVTNRLVLAFVSSVLLAGCSLTPQYQQPEPPVPAHWDVSEPDLNEELHNLDLSWQAFFPEPALQALISASLENNQDMRVAALNVEVLRARYQIERSALYPGLSIGVGAARQRVPGNLSVSGSDEISERYDASVGLTSYEIDFFAKTRNLSAAALENYLATAQAKRSFQTSLISEVANTYFSWRTNRKQLALARATQRSFEQNLALIQRRYDSDVASALELTQAETLVHQARTQVAQFDRLARQAVNALAFFSGHNLPEGMTSSLPESPPLNIEPLGAGLSSDLLKRRPDILEAEHRLKAAYADIGAARAAFFPSITLTASAGTASSELNELFGGGSGSWLFEPRINLPIFTGGRNKANLEVSETTKKIRLAEYNRAIQQAFREVADSLAARDTLRDQLNAQQALVDTLDEYYQLAQNRYDAGITSYLAVLDAQREHFSARQQLLSDRFNQLSAEIELFRSLGGGVGSEIARVDRSRAQ